MVAPGSTAPVPSRTMPLMLPVAVCAEGVAITVQTTANARTTLRTMTAPSQVGRASASVGGDLLRILCTLVTWTTQHAPARHVQRRSRLGRAGDHDRPIIAASLRDHGPRNGRRQQRRKFGRS